MPSPVTVAMLNRKGGVGKTSTTWHLAGTLAKAGKRVLLVDLDPQASLTQGIMGPEATESLTLKQTVAGLFDDRFDPEPDSLVRDTGFERIRLVPGSNDLDDHNTPQPQAAGAVQYSVRALLREVRDQYDIALLDCPPNLHLCSWSALVASDFVVVPLQAEDYGSQGIIHVQKAIDLALARHNPQLRLLGYLVTMYIARLGVHIAYERQLRTLYGEQVFTATVPMVKDYKEAIAARRPIAHYKPRSGAAKAMQAVADEFLTRCESVGRQPAEFLYLGNRVGPQEALETEVVKEAA